MNPVEGVGEIGRGQTGPSELSPTAQVGWSVAVRAAWEVLRLPVRIVALGMAVFLLTWMAAKYLPIP